MTRRPHRLLSIRLSTFTALLAIAGLALGIVALRDGGSASKSNDPLPKTAFASTTKPVSTATSATDVYNSTHTGVVKITTSGGLGTGIVLDSRGDILTNDHVVDGSSNYRVTFDNNTARSATLVGQDASSDLAVIKISPNGLNLHPLTLGDSSTVQVGDTVYALGNPFGYTNSFSEGIVSGLDRSMTAPNGFTIAHSIQTDAAINPGNSGGPLLDASGNVVGINAQIASNGNSAGGQGQNNGVGFAIPINTAKTVVAQLEQSGHVSHGYLGVSTADPQSGTGALVGGVQPGSPAESAGLQQGDVIKSVNGTQIVKSDDVAAAIASLKPGDRVQLGIDRGGSSKTVTVTLGDQPNQAPNG